MKFSIILCVKKLKDITHAIEKSREAICLTWRCSLSSFGLIVAADCCSRTSLVVNSEAVFFILICETNIIPFFFSNYGFTQKIFFDK
jgi:hypothetical protein